MFKRIFTIIFAVIMATSVSGAQTLHTGFFTDNYAYIHRVNPALSASRSEVTDYTSLGVGNIIASAHTDAALTDFLFPTQDGGLVLGLDNSIPSQEFLSGLNDLTSLRVDISESLLSFGYKERHGYLCNTEVNVRSVNGAGVPKKLFSLLKDGGDISNIRFDDLGADSRTFVEFVLGSSKRYGDYSFGLKVKVLAGIAGANADANTVSVQSTDAGLSAKVNASLGIAAAPLSILSDSGTLHSPEYDKFRFSGMGAAVDLGFVYTGIDGLELSAALLDLGGINWKNEIRSDVLMDFAQEDSAPVLTDNKPGKEWVWIPATVNLGARYDISESLSAGLLATTGFGKYAYREVRAGASYTTGRLFNASLTGALSNCGAAAGAMVNLLLGPVNIFAGIDQMIFRFTPQWIPTGRVNTTLSLGLNVAW